jgi:ATP-dependent helicase YprA (DUF1998 family)
LNWLLILAWIQLRSRFVFPKHSHKTLQVCCKQVSAAVAESVKAIRALSLEELPELARQLIPWHRMPISFINTLPLSQKTDAFLACLLVWTLSNGKEVPREFQLEAGLAAVSGRDTVIIAGTGMGKTALASEKTRPLRYWRVVD